MACGSCGQRYQKTPYTVVASNNPGTTQGVIKKEQLEEIERRNAVQIKKGEATPPPPTPVDGASGPSNKPE